MDKNVIMKVRNLKKTYKNKKEPVLKNISLDIYKNEILGIVGESGSGKSTLGKCIVNLEKIDSGKILFQGEDMYLYSRKLDKKLKKEMQVIFQDPYSTLNPSHTVGWHIEEPLKVHTRLTKEERREKALKYLELVGLDREYYDKSPAQLSGGQRQRVMIIAAIILEPKIIIADESVSALDVSVQAQILNIFMEMREKMDLTIIFITHDLSIVNYLCDRVAVLNSGEIVEIGDAEEVISRPTHEYTKKLLASKLGGFSSSKKEVKEAV